MNTSYAVAFYATEVRPRKKGQSYRVRWTVAKEKKGATFYNSKQAGLLQDQVTGWVTQPEWLVRS